jgi:hypothetical protein
MNESDEKIANDSIDAENTVLKNIRALTAENLSSASRKKLRESLVGRRSWSFILPAGAHSGRGGLTANCFNLRFGPFALRVMTKTKEELGKQLFRLGEMMRHPNYLENMREETAWEKEATTLREMFHQLCGIEKGSADGDAIIQGWKSPHDIQFCPEVISSLGKVWVYVGKGEEPHVDRVYIREKLMNWVDGKLSGVNIEGSQSSTGASSASLKLALHPFDIWVPCEMLDEYCCLSDIPGMHVCELYLDLA